MCTYVAEGDRAARGRCYITQLPDSLRGRPAATGKKRETGRRVARPAHVGADPGPDSLPRCPPLLHPLTFDCFPAPSHSRQ